jgi:hypothetical protein
MAHLYGGQERTEQQLGDDPAAYVVPHGAI